MKKTKMTLAVILMVCALLALTACGRIYSSSGNASPGNASDGNASSGDAYSDATSGDAEYWGDYGEIVTDGNASDGNAFREYTAAAENARQVKSIPFPEDQMLCLTTEYNRLYTLGGDGEVRLLENANVDYYSHNGGKVTAAIDGDGLWDIDLTTGEKTFLLAAKDEHITNPLRYENGVVFDCYNANDSYVGVWDDRAGEIRNVTSEEKDGWIYDFAVSDGILVCQLYSQDRGTVLTAYDPRTLEQLWWGPSDGNESLYCFDGKIFAANTYEYGRTTPAEIFELDPHTGKRTATGLQVPSESWSLLYTDGECALVEFYDGEYCAYYLRGDRILRLTGNLFPVNSSRFYADDNDNVILLSVTQYQQSAASDWWYAVTNFVLVDKTTGNIAPAKVSGQYESLFSSGDFPVMDSSTARKPITSVLYSFFCESTGYGGAAPLCSTTHGAWLNIADRTADIALLAAPTREEQEYLDSKDVEVEMKLYGGDGLVFITGRSSGVDNLTLDQLRSIYRGEITNWKELGGADHPIRVLFRDDQSGSQRLFESLLWKGTEVPDLSALGFERLDEMSTIVWEIVADPYAIGYSIMTYLNDVYSEEELLCLSLEGYAATPENIKAGTYPLGTRGYVVIRADEPERSPARRLYDFFGTPLCDYLLTINGITPLSE